MERYIIRDHNKKQQEGIRMLDKAVIRFYSRRDGKDLLEIFKESSVIFYSSYLKRKVETEKDRRPHGSNGQYDWLLIIPVRPEISMIRMVTKLMLTGQITVPSSVSKEFEEALEDMGIIDWQKVNRRSSSQSSTASSSGRSQGPKSPHSNRESPPDLNLGSSSPADMSEIIKIEPKQSKPDIKPDVKPDIKPLNKIEENRKPSTSFKIPKLEKSGSSGDNSKRVSETPEPHQESSKRRRSESSLDRAGDTQKTTVTRVESSARSPYPNTPKVSDTHVRTGESGSSGSKLLSSGIMLSSPVKETRPALIPTPNGPAIFPVGPSVRTPSSSAIIKLRVGNSSQPVPLGRSSSTSTSSDGRKGWLCCPYEGCILGATSMEILEKHKIQIHGYKPSGPAKQSTSPSNPPTGITPTGSTSELLKKTSAEIVEEFGLKDIQYDYCDADYQNLTSYKLFSQHMHPLIAKANPKLAMSRTVILISAKWREFNRNNPKRLAGVELPDESTSLKSGSSKSALAASSLTAPKSVSTGTTPGLETAANRVSTSNSRAAQAINGSRRNSSTSTSSVEVLSSDSESKSPKKAALHPSFRTTLAKGTPVTSSQGTSRRPAGDERRGSTEAIRMCVYQDTCSHLRFSTPDELRDHLQQNYV